MPTYRVQHFDQKANDTKVEGELDLLEERRLEAEIKTVAHRRKVEHSFNRRVQPWPFKVRDLVLRQTGVMTQAEGKLGPRWEGPYVVTTSGRPGSY